MKKAVCINCPDFATVLVDDLAFCAPCGIAKQQKKKKGPNGCLGAVGFLLMVPFLLAAFWTFFQALVHGKDMTGFGFGAILVLGPPLLIGMLLMKLARY